ncbi:hypothetical protein [Bordetella ansorpii]|nr:hypothetical protein [Bordetella ansorpii]
MVSSWARPVRTECTDKQGRRMLGPGKAGKPSSGKSWGGRKRVELSEN